MKVMKFSEIRNDFINSLRKNIIIPVLGSGFSRACKSNSGKVPSGEEYKNYMIDQIIAVIPLLTKEDIRDLKNMTFSEISSIYHKKIPIELQKKYLRNNFKNVHIDEFKKNFLSINWPYIYTLNIDDSIERNSNFNHTVNANRPVNNDIYNQEKCVVKLHGDVNEMLTYEDSQSEVFTQEQYVISLKKNTSLLDKLKHDIIFQNIIYIGCSLNDEVDLLSVSLEDKKISTNRYFCMTKEPSMLDKIKFEKFGITHIVLFETYNSLYKEIYQAWIESQQIRLDDLDYFKINHTNSSRLSADYEQNKPYLFYGKSLITTDRSIILPYFFISRAKTELIIDNIHKYPIQIILGTGCSGRTYTMIDIAWRTRDRDVFVFETKDSLSDLAFDTLITKENCIILVDSNALSLLQIEEIFKKQSKLKRNNVNFIIFESKNNRDLSGLLNLLEQHGKIDINQIPQIELDNRFKQKELEVLNPLLTAISVGVFGTEYKTIVDNIIEKSNNLLISNKYQKISPKLGSIRDIATLISLAVEKKLYSEKVIQYDIFHEISLQVKCTSPLIDMESTWTFERSNSRNSTVKYLVNAEYWLYNQLSEYARSAEKQDTIVEAYIYIVSKIIEHEGKPSLYFKNNSSYKSYILFDNINQLFSLHRHGSLSLIRKIYEGLNTLLSTDPNYMHQRSKCYIRSMFSEKDIPQKLSFLDKAFRDSNVAYQVFDERYKESKNDKLLISIAHVQYTRAIIECHKCIINEYLHDKENERAIGLLYVAMSSSFNSYDYAKKDAINKNNVIRKLVTYFISNKEGLDLNSVSQLEELFQLMLA